MGLRTRLYRAFTRTMSPHRALRLGVTGQDLVLRNLQILGFEPALVLDVGAYEGHWTKSVKGIFPGAEYLLFEALADKRSVIQQTLAQHQGWHLYSEVLSHADGMVVRFSEMETGSSYYDELTPYPRQIVTRTARTLDSLLNDRPLEGDIYVKMDTQGSELDILAGGKRLLAAATLVSIETSNIPYNRGAPTTEDVIAFMSAHGFKIFDILEFHRRGYDGLLFQMDILFINARTPLYERNSDFSKGI